MPERRRLEELVRAGHPCVAIQTFEEDEALAVVRDTALELSRGLWAWTISRGLHDGMIADAAPVPDTAHAAAALCHLNVHPAHGRLVVFLDLAGHLKDERTLRQFRELLATNRRTGSTLVLIDHAHLPPVAAAHATLLELAPPDERRLEEIVRQTVLERRLAGPVRVDLSRQDLRAIVRNLSGLSARQARQVILDVLCDDGRLDGSDVDHVVARKRRYLGSTGPLEFIESPTDLSQIGGLRRLKAWLGERRNALSDEAVAFGIEPPRGVLMLGVQGAGKSLAAKAVATAWQRPLLRLDPGALYDRYVGESERQLRDALRQAEAMAPVVLWIDEVEKGFASAASQSTDGGLSKRMFGTLLTWMQDHAAPVFLIATANDIEALPPELLRKGRFDEIFFVDLPTAEARAQIFAIHLRKRQRDPARFDLPALAAASEGYSGAEIEQAVIGALHAAFAAGRAELTTEHVLRALRQSPPLSVTMAEKVSALRRWSQGRCVPAD